MSTTENHYITTVIVDLDNTLFDWFKQWYHSFDAMLDKIVEISGVSRDILIDEIRVIHQKHHTSEYAFLIEEIPSLLTKHPDGELISIYKDAVEAFREERRKHLHLYPGVLATFLALKERGVKIVAYTESMAFYSAYRIRKLGLDGLIDILYSPADHVLPEGLTAEQIRKYPSERYEFQITEHRHTPAGQLKPNPDVLREILSGLGVEPSECVYVGDSLMKDIAMANSVGVISVHAEYGVVQHQPSYDLLRRVSHWTQADVERERNFPKGDVVPNYTLCYSLTELLSRFSFGRKDEYLDRTITAWEKTIEVQQHFNELSLKVRGLAITVLGALLSAVAFSLKEQVKNGEGMLAVPVVVPVLFGVALFAWIAFWMMDYFWYHQLLKGASIHAVKIEKELAAIPAFKLATAISDASKVKVKCLGVFDSKRRLRIYYGLVALGLVFAACWSYSHSALSNSAFAATTAVSFPSSNTGKTEAVANAAQEKSLVKATSKVKEADPPRAAGQLPK